MIVSSGVTGSSQISSLGPGKGHLGKQAPNGRATVLLCAAL